jgi:signal transduction histidine kinase
VGVPAQQEGDSRRVAEGHAVADSRLRRQRDLLRPLGWAVIAVVMATMLTEHPAPGVHGVGLGTAVATGVFVLSTLVAIGDRFLDRPSGVQLWVIAAMGASGVAMSALEPHGATDLAAGAAVWMAITRLPFTIGVSAAAAIIVGQGAAAARTGSPAVVLAATLLGVLLGLVAYLMRQGREAQDRTELLLAQLADSRDAQAHAAAAAERGRIAADLHDVLAHALSAAAIQLQGARLLAEREQVSLDLGRSVDRASQLVAAGLVNARQAVSALRGEQPVTQADLEALVEGLRHDMDIAITLHVDGTVHELPAQAGLALYRAVQESVTNAARYAPGAIVNITLSYEPGLALMRVENTQPTTVAAPEMSGIGGGHGLIGLRERLERAGGTIEAGPHGAGWMVEVKVPR